MLRAAVLETERVAPGDQHPGASPREGDAGHPPWCVVQDRRRGRAHTSRPYMARCSRPRSPVWGSRGVVSGLIFARVSSTFLRQFLSAFSPSSRRRAASAFSSSARTWAPTSAGAGGPAGSPPPAGGEGWPVSLSMIVSSLPSVARWWASIASSRALASAGGPAGGPPAGGPAAGGGVAGGVAGGWFLSAIACSPHRAAHPDIAGLAAERGDDGLQVAAEVAELPELTGDLLQQRPVIHRFHWVISVVSGGHNREY